MLIPKERDSFAVTTGKYAGEILIFHEKKDLIYNFISIPDVVLREVPIDKFNFGLNENLLDFIENIPENVYDVLVAQYKKNIS